MNQHDIDDTPEAWIDPDLHERREARRHAVLAAIYAGEYHDELDAQEHDAGCSVSMRDRQNSKRAGIAAEMPHHVNRRKTVLDNKNSGQSAS